MRAFLAIAGLLVLASPSAAQSVDEWITIGTRVHGGFGAFIPLGIRIGQDALKKVDAVPREVSVVYTDGAKAPCACIADGVAIATSASVGQRSLQIAPDKAPDGTLATITVRNKKTGRTARYTVPDSVMPRIVEWNKLATPHERYQAIMDADGLYVFSPAD